MTSPLSQWISRELTKLLDFEVSDDISNYILSFDGVDDVEDYVSELLDKSVPRNQKFIKELLQRWRPPPKLPQNVQVYRKQDTEDTYLPSKQSKGNKKKGKKNVENIDRAASPSQNKVVAPVSSPPRVHQSSPGPADTAESPEDSKRKKKFVPLFSKDGEARTVAQLPGRHGCECLATKHALVNNCMSCGRIVCVQEGSGPCLFCGNLVCTKDEEEILSRGSKKSEKLRSQLMSGAMLPNQQAAYEKGLERAMEHKNRLLEYDKTSAKRTQVIDDESDYFNADSNRWLSHNEREKLSKREKELREKRHSSRRDRKVTLDIAGRRVMEGSGAESVDMYDVNDDVVQEVYYGKKGGAQNGTNGEAVFMEEDFGSLVNPTVTMQPQFLPGKTSFASATSNGAVDSTDQKKKSMRLQDRELQEMVDEGQCMSMHQPWATLLVKGIKKHEGRSWYTAHRGRLWIAATSQKAQESEIHMMQDFYRSLYKDPSLEFPSDYPSGCLLGCVDVQDCMEQDVYRAKYPNGESNSPYVFVCENPHELLVKFPLKGKHKIYKLDGKLHQGARKGIHAVTPAH